jgi:hypothetical protein
MRAQLGFGGRVYFPADVSRRKNGHKGVFPALPPPQIYRRINALFKLFGIDQSLARQAGAARNEVTLRNGGQTLRNTYAAILIERGETDEVIAEALGLFADFSVPRLRDAHQKWLALQAKESQRQASISLNLLPVSSQFCNLQTGGTNEPE